MFGISGIELAIIIVVAFLIFGPDKLPGVIKNVTHIWEVLKGLRQQADQVIKAEVVEPLKDIEASVNPFVEEGKSATDMLAKRLGIKPDTPKKAEPKPSEVKIDPAAEKATATQTVKLDDSGTSNEAATVAAGAAVAASTEGTATKAKPSKPKTESFAEKKAALERAYREQQKPEPENTAAATSAESNAETAVVDETAGE